MRVVYLPGMSGRGAFWEPVARRLPQHWEQRLLDWPGLGGNEPDPQISSFDDLVGLAVSAIDGPTALVAQSMGGVVAVGAALLASASVTHLVLSATSGGIDLDRFGARDWRADYGTSWPNAPAWAFARPPDLTSALQELRVPTLLLWASDDPISPVGVGQELQRQIVGARLVVVQTADHMFAQSDPDSVAPAIRDHLAD